MPDPIVDAINDQTRVMLALQGNFSSKAEIIRRFDQLSIPQSRIAAILAMDPKDVSSSLTKSRKKMAKDQLADAGDSAEVSGG